MANWIKAVPYVKKTVTTSTWTKLVEAQPQRRYLAWRNNSGGDSFIGVVEDGVTPTGTGDSSDLFVDGEKQYWDASVMPTGAVWAYQTTGTDSDIHIAAIVD